MRDQSFLTWGAFSFIVQGGAPIYSYLALCLCTIGAQVVLVSRRGPLSKSGVGELDPGDLLVQGMILAISLGGTSPRCCPILAQSDWRDCSDGRSICTVLVGSASSTATVLVSSVETKAGAWLGLPGLGQHSGVVVRC